MGFYTQRPSGSLAGCGCNNALPGCEGPYICPPPVGLSVVSQTFAVDTTATGPGTHYKITTLYSDNSVTYGSITVPPAASLVSITLTPAEATSNG